MHLCFHATSLHMDVHGIFSNAAALTLVATMCLSWITHCKANCSMHYDCYSVWVLKNNNTIWTLKPWATWHPISNIKLVISIVSMWYTYALLLCIWIHEQKGKKVLWQCDSSWTETVWLSSKVIIPQYRIIDVLALPLAVAQSHYRYISSPGTSTLPCTYSTMCTLRFRGMKSNPYKTVLSINAEKLRFEKLYSVHIALRFINDFERFAWLPRICYIKFLTVSVHHSLFKYSLYSCIFHFNDWR